MCKDIPPLILTMPTATTDTNTSMHTHCLPSRNRHGHNQTVPRRLCLAYLAMVIVSGMYHAGIHWQIFLATRPYIPLETNGLLFWQQIPDGCIFHWLNRNTYVPTIPYSLPDNRHTAILSHWLYWYVWRMWQRGHVLSERQCEGICEEYAF